METFVLPFLNLVGWAMTFAFGGILLFFIWTMIQDLDEVRQYIFALTFCLLLLGIALIFV